MIGSDSTDEQILAARSDVPEHVVHRTFPEETIVLNLESGVYHGLNATAGRMLDVMETGVTVSEAAGAVSRDLGAPPETVRRDILDLCRLLLERGLIELHDP